MKLSMTAADPMSFAMPASGWRSVPDRSTTASTALFNISTTKISSIGDTSNARSTPERPRKTPRGIQRRQAYFLAEGSLFAPRVQEALKGIGEGAQQARHSDRFISLHQDQHSIRTGIVCAGAARFSTACRIYRAID